MNTAEFFVIGYVIFWLFTLRKINIGTFYYPYKKSNWVLLVLIFPFLGLILFWLIGQYRMMSPSKAVKTDNIITDITHIEETEVKGPETKECPMCAETIKSAAKKCRFCGHLLT